MTTDRHLEACPECAQRDIAPMGTTRTTPETVVCDYTCPRCGCEWITGRWGE